LLGVRQNQNVRQADQHYLLTNSKTLPITSECGYFSTNLLAKLSITSVSAATHGQFSVLALPVDN
jgi:hypothetical protein